MLNNITIRGGLTLVICVFVAFLLTVIGVGYGALKLASNGLQDVQRNSVALTRLNAWLLYAPPNGESDGSQGRKRSRPRLTVVRDVPARLLA